MEGDGDGSAGRRSATSSAAELPKRAARAVLLVDDELDVRRTTERLIRRLGFEVLCADSGPQAIELFRARSSSIALVVTDLTMPGMDGVAVGKELRALSPDVPMILITGYGEVRDGGALFRGALAKPFGFDTLAELIERVLADDADR